MAKDTQAQAFLGELVRAMIKSARAGQMEPWRDNWKGTWLEPYFPPLGECAGDGKGAYAILASPE